MSADADVDVKVARHRTAMVRHSLSQPVALLAASGLLRPGVSMFDYGCGQGDDLSALRSGGIEANGWDPHYAPDHARCTADIVNLGFVLNVIENPDERIEALERAWSLSRSVLAVSTMIVGQAPVGGLRSYRDGYLTSRGTFQKYFQHAELRGLLVRVLGTQPAAAAPGIFFAFKREEDQAEYLLGRQSARRSSTAAFRSQRERSSERPPRPELAELLDVEIEILADLMLKRGRPPHADEIPAAVLEGLADKRTSLARALEVTIASMEDGMYAEARDRRREDLVVNRALSMLDASRPATSAGMMRDARALFGSQAELAGQAKSYLFSLADGARMGAAIRAAADAGNGLVDSRGRLVVNAADLSVLPGALRCYAGCATQLCGEPVSEFILRLDPVRRRVTLMVLDASRDVLPTTSQDVLVDLRRQEVNVVARRRRLLRWADLTRAGPRTKLRAEERRYRQTVGVPDTDIFEDAD